MHFSAHRRQLLLAGAATALPGGARAAPRPLRTDWPRRKHAPPLTLPRLDGGAWSLGEQRGHVVLLNFWASWCESCVEEMPSLARLAAREREGGLRILAVNYREATDTIHRFLDARALPLDIALDRDGSAAKAFDVHAFPSTVAIGADGRVRFVVMGECDWTDERGRRWLDELRAA